MLFSVIVPVHNVESYLRQCLNSLVYQTCTDREIILVDDGSTDDSGAICDEYAGKYDCVNVIHQENKGTSAARNVGLAEATGEWIFFVDSDDWIDGDLLELLYDHIIAAHADWYGFQLTGDEENESISESEDASITDLAITFQDEEKKFKFFCDNFIKIGCSVCGAYRHSLITKLGLTFYEGLSYGEDILFCFQYLLHVHKLVFLCRAPYHYRKREESRSTKTYYEQRLWFCSWFVETAYQSAQEMPVFQEKFYRLYFQIFNAFISIKPKNIDDCSIRKILDELWKQQFNRDCIEKIRRQDFLFREYTNECVWYSKDFGR